jgi:hypothetical protein
MQTLLIILAVVIVTALAVVLLGYRDMVERRKKENARPLEERIAEIHKWQVEGIAGGERILTWEIAKEHPERFEWVKPLMEYERRLADLAASPTASSQDADALVDEIGAFLRNTGIRNIFTEHSARKLADLLRIREGKQKP